MEGILPINKPRGMTSHDVVFKLRKILHTKKIGHSGTLDPNVDGVLPICIGAATKVVPYLMDSGKVYKGTVTLGFATETEDLDGEEVTRTPLRQPFTDAQILIGMDALIGDIEQIPPMYSAVKVNGRKLYEYARAGETVERPVRRIHVDYFKQTGASTFDEAAGTQTIPFEIGCGKGTYVRTLSVQLGEQLGVPAVMSDLTRLKSGGFDLTQTATLEEVTAAMDAGTINQLLRPIDVALAHYPVVELDRVQWQIVTNGGFLPSSILAGHDVVAVKYADHIKALYQQHPIEKSLAKPLKMFSNHL
ncbi:tRNA pseudouridine(55) synthase TruB [Furfurilactobacillus siliginis]|uniref:tRNA pseudouridine synthase B n=1 Tax=Furfurilactobacillus siliginis TaxID=348151 RepID=A0A0R2L0Y9_9LACO|nr:tRNA pseudouridine(55) synthase TruB [Furfurilactobacillus siliginis]KRN95363.1 tRNA pseudouridine synthase B [Furfurilactobacillus siliginis]GEK28142.1 tRNA pseudouridine synthase B [Furfurilactobacillus siliginis]